MHSIVSAINYLNTLEGRYRLHQLVQIPEESLQDACRSPRSGPRVNSIPLRYFRALSNMSAFVALDVLLRGVYTWLSQAEAVCILGPRITSGFSKQVNSFSACSQLHAIQPW